MSFWTQSSVGGDASNTLELDRARCALPACQALPPSAFAIAEPMRGLRRFAFDHKHLRPLQDLAIGNACAFVLPQVLYPRFVHEAFQVQAWIRRFVKKLPEIRAVATAHFAHRAHRGDKLGTLGRLNPVGD